MKRYPYILIVLCLFFSYCSEGSSRQVTTVRENPALQKEIIQEPSRITDLRLDSLQLEQFLAKQTDTGISSRIRKFYRNRDYQYAWFTSDGPTEQVQIFWNMHQEYVRYTKDSSLVDRAFHDRVQSILDGEENPDPASGTLAEQELQLTTHFFDFSKYAFTGRIDPEELQWHIPRKKVNAGALLDSLFATSGENAASWIPQSKQYRALKEQLLRYDGINKTGTQATFSLGNRTVLKEGDTAPVVQVLKRHLHLLGDLRREDTSAFFDSRFRQAVRRFQKRHGLKQDGVIGPAVLRQVNVPVEARMEQILINMERMRWLPQRPEGTSIIANIPEFKIRVYEGAREALSMNIVVGKAANRTVIFGDELEYVVFSPYWNIPRSIVRNEILPAMKRNSNYLAARNMEVTGNSNGLPVIRQRPGGGNALGKVKFIFPNRYNIYFHDTPAKSLFSRTQRAFSHGCIRLESPFKMAQYLLRNSPEWTDERIRGAMNSDKEKWVKLDRKLPVLIVYVTAWVDEGGVLNFREDLYGHDRKMASRLFEHDGEVKQ